MSIIQEIAEIAEQSFKTILRQADNKTIYIVKDDCMEWVKGLIKETHGDMFPDDWKYEFIHEAFQAIAEHNDEDVEFEEISNLSFNQNNSRLFDWVRSHASRVEYVEEAIKENGLNADNFSLSNSLALGQMAERLEIYHNTKYAISQMAEQKFYQLMADVYGPKEVE